MQQIIEQLVQYARDIWHRRWIGLGAAWIVAVVGAVVVYRLPDNYEASARVYVDTQTILRPLLAGMTVTPDSDRQVAILSRLLLTRPNIAKIIRKSDLDTAAKQQVDDLIDATLGALTIARVSSADNIYTIAFRYTDGRKARDVVQAALATFIDQSIGTSRTDTEAARRFVDAQIADYDKKLDESEIRLQEFRLKHLGLLGAGTANSMSQLEALADKIKEARLELRVAEQARDGIKNQQSDQLGSEGDAEPAPVVVAESVPEIDARIDALKSRVDEALRRYTELHPDIVSARRLIAQLQAEREEVLDARRKAAAAQAAARPAAIAAGNPVAQQLKVALNEAEANVNTMRARIAVLEAESNRIKERAEALPRLDTELSQLNRDYQIQKRQYEALVQRRETASLSGKFEDASGPEFRIIDPPRVTPKPVSPARLQLLAVVLLASLLAGVAVSLGVSQIRPAFHDGRALRETVRRPLLGMVSTIASPALKRRQLRAAFLFAGAFGGLLASYSAAVLFTYLAIRGS